MEESVTYQAIVPRGRAEGARRFLLLLDQKKFGPPDAAARQSIEGITELSQLEELGLRLLSANNLQELLLPAALRRRGRRRADG